MSSVNPVSGPSSNWSITPKGRVDRINDAKERLSELLYRFLSLAGGQENIGLLPPEWQQYLSRGLTVVGAVEQTDSSILAKLSPEFVGSLERYVASVEQHVNIAETVRDRKGYDNILTLLDKPPLSTALGPLLDQSFSRALENLENELGIA